MKRQVSAVQSLKVLVGFLIFNGLGLIIALGVCDGVGRIKAARLAADLSQAGLAERAGVSYGTLKRFETKGAASLEVAVRLALTLEGGFDGLFTMPKFTSMDEVVSTPTKRQRGMKK